MKEKFYFKLWQKNEIEEPATWDSIKRVGNPQAQVMNPKTGWHWLPDFEKQMKLTKANKV